MIDDQLTKRFESLKGSDHEAYFKAVLSRLSEADEPREQALQYMLLHQILSTFNAGEAHES